MPPRATEDEVNNNDEKNDDANEAEIGVNDVLSYIYIDLHRQTTKHIDFNARNLSPRLSAIILAIGKSPLSICV